MNASGSKIRERMAYFFIDIHMLQNTKDELVLNKAYREMGEHYGTAIIPTA